MVWNPPEAERSNRAPSYIVHIGEVPPLSTVSIHRDRVALSYGSNEPEHAHVRAATRPVDCEISQHNGVHACAGGGRNAAAFPPRFSRLHKEIAGDCSRHPQRWDRRSWMPYTLDVEAKMNWRTLELPAQLQQVEGAEDVGLVAGAGILHAGSDTGLSREVNDRRNGATSESVKECAANTFVVSDVSRAIRELRICLRCLAKAPAHQRRSESGCHVVHDPVTQCPDSSKSRDTFDPMNPPQPVTRMFIRVTAPPYVSRIGCVP